MVAYSELEHWGPLADDQRAGQICATVANVNRNPETRPQPWTAADFMPALAEIRARAAPVQIDDPQQHTAALDRMLFGARK